MLEDADYFEEEESRAEYAKGEDPGIGGNILTTSARMNQKKTELQMKYRQIMLIFCPIGDEQSRFVTHTMDVFYKP